MDIGGLKSKIFATLVLMVLFVSSVQHASAYRPIRFESNIVGTLDPDLKIVQIVLPIDERNEVVSILDIDIFVPRSDAFFIWMPEFTLPGNLEIASGNQLVLYFNATWHHELNYGDFVLGQYILQFSYVRKCADRDANDRVVEEELDVQIKEGELDMPEPSPVEPLATITCAPVPKIVHPGTKWVLGITGFIIFAGIILTVFKRRYGQAAQL